MSDDKTGVAATTAAINTAAPAAAETPYFTLSYRIPTPEEELIYSE